MKTGTTGLGTTREEKRYTTADDGIVKERGKL